MRDFFRDFDEQILCVPVSISTEDMIVLFALAFFSAVHFVGYIVAAIGALGPSGVLQVVGAWGFILTLVATTIVKLLRRRQIKEFEQEMAQQIESKGGHYVDPREHMEYTKRAANYTAQHSRSDW